MINLLSWLPVVSIIAFGIVALIFTIKFFDLLNKVDKILEILKQNKR